MKKTLKMKPLSLRRRLILLATAAILPLTFANAAQAQIAPLVPAVCGGVEADAYLLDGMGIGSEQSYQLLSGSATHDPDVFFGPSGAQHAYTKNADGSVDFFFDGEAPVFTLSSDVDSNPTFQNQTSVNGRAADQTDAAEFFRITTRLDGVPGQTYSYTFNNGGAHEFLYYWVEDSAGAVIGSSVGAPNSAAGWMYGTGSNVSTSSANGATSIAAQITSPVSYTIPSSSPDGIVYLNIMILDPQAAWGQLNLSSLAECPEPELTFAKLADDNTDRAIGETITYTYTVTNSGNVNVSDVSISDDHTSGAGTVTVAPAGETADAGILPVQRMPRPMTAFGTSSHPVMS